MPATLTSKPWIHVHDIEQGTPEWIELRSGLYTGTSGDKLLADAAKTKIVDGITSRYAAAENTGFGGNFFTKRGHILEEEAIELYEAITGHTVSRPGFITNDRYPSCGYSPDGHDDSLGILLEVKCFNEQKHLEIYHAKHPIGEIPRKILAQIYFGRLIWEKRRARLIIYNPDLEADLAFKIIDLPFGRDIIANFKRILTV